MGLGLVALGVGCLEFALDKGQEKDWFGDPIIRHCSRLAHLPALLLIRWEWNHPHPIVDLKLLKNRNFGTAVFLQLILGMVLFGSTVLIPQYLQGLLGYTAERAGMVLSPAGFVMMAMMAVAGRTVGKMDPRLMVCLRLHRHRHRRLQPHPARPHHQLRSRHGTAHVAGHRAAVRLHPHQHVELCGRASDQDQPDIQPLQLRAKPGRKRRYRTPYNLYCAQFAGASVSACG